MKRFHGIAFFCVFSYISFLFGHGFSPGTLVKGAQGYQPIETLQIDDKICGHGSDHGYVAAINATRYDTIVDIRIDDHVITCSSEQQFLTIDNRWIAACALQRGDQLLTADGDVRIVEGVTNKEASQLLYTLTVVPSHVYSVSPYDLLAHNIVHVITIALPVALPQIVSAAATVGASALKLGGALFVVDSLFLGGVVREFIGDLFARNKKKSRAYQAPVVKSTDKKNQLTSLPPEDPEKKDKKETIAGKKEAKDEKSKDANEAVQQLIYENAQYHTLKGSGKKSACPKDGQKALDNSFIAEANVDPLVAPRVAMENEEFIALRPSAPGIYHGYICPWNDLSSGMQQALIRAGKVRSKKGKII